MSLLMDALKRAEKARQAEDSSDRTERDLTSTQGLGLDPVEEREPAEQPLPGTSTPDQPDSGSELSLENTQSLRGRLGIEEDDARPAVPLDDSYGRSLDSISLIDDEHAVDVPHHIPEDTSATLPSAKQARQSVDNYFDGSGSGSVSLTRDDLESTIPGETAGPQQRVDEDTETQRRVRAVFHAKAARRGGPGRNWVVVALVPLLLLLIVGGVVLVFWDNLAVMLSDKPRVAHRAPRTTAQPVVEPVPQASALQTAVAADTSQPGVSTTAPVVSSAPPDGGAAAQTPTVAAGETTAAPDATQGSQATMTELAESAPTAEQLTNPSDQDSGRRLSAEEQVDRAIQRAGLAPVSPTGGAAFKIKRRSTPDKLHPRLLRAYHAWRSGNLVAARRDYESVLKSEPRNRDALLGLGAIAVRNGRWDDASERYTTLLGLNPRDSIAQAGLIAVHENVDPLRGESQIKLLLREEPDAPHLHFTLGNLFAEQNRWGEAQSAYFDAYRLQSNNADYAYNVAVSLDQMGKAGAASDYYRLALALAADNNAVFDQPSVRNRLLKLAFESAAQ
jgi:Flp pilus assembly protein TadD